MAALLKRGCALLTFALMIVTSQVVLQSGTKTMRTEVLISSYALSHGGDQTEAFRMLSAAQGPPTALTEKVRTSGYVHTNFCAVLVRGLGQVLIMSNAAL